MTHQLNFIYNDSDWVCPNEYPDLRHAKEIAIDIETKDPNHFDDFFDKLSNAGITFSDITNDETLAQFVI